MQAQVSRDLYYLARSPVEERGKLKSLSVESW